MSMYIPTKNKPQLNNGDLLLKNARNLTLYLGTLSICALIAGCSGSDSSSSTSSTITYTTINSSTVSTNLTSLTGIRGVNSSSNVFITGGTITSSKVYSNQLYVGPITGGGVYYTLNVPGSNSSTTSYSADNWLVNQVEVAGNATINGSSRGFLYQGPIANNDGVGKFGTAPWYDITYTSTGNPYTGTAYSSIPHSVMNNIVVGGFERGAINAYLCDITTPASPDCNDMSKAFASLAIPPLSTSAYGVWWNGGTSYTIVGGYTNALTTDLASPSATGVKGFIVDYDSSTKIYKNFTSYNYNNDTSGLYITHFEGITFDTAKGGYNLVGEGMLSSGALAGGLCNVTRNADGSFTTSPKWVAISYPGATTTNYNTVYQNNILGTYQPGAQVLNGYVANIPTSLY